MPKRSAIRKPLRYAKQGVASAFVCTVALFPLLGLWQTPTQFIKSDPRKVVELHTLNIRPVDANNGSPKIFMEPLISVTFDDGKESVYTQAAPLLQKYGILTTQYIISGTAKDTSYVSSQQIDSLRKAGHEIGCHTVSHPDLTTIDTTQLANELVGCKDALSRFGYIENFASPYGHTDDKVIDQVRQHYLSHRNTNGDITNGVNELDINIADSFNRYNIISAAIRHDTTVEQLQTAVQYATEHNGWIVFTYHQIEDSTNSTFGLDTSKLEKQLEYLSSTPIKINTISNILKNFDNYNVSAMRY